MMEKRIKKPPVTPEQAIDWLNRNDQGESAPEIAKKDEYDVRTVRSHLQQKRQERERNEARASVLRNALEDHYRDLCNYALKLDPTNPPATTIPALPADDSIMESALRQHIPRSSIWNLRTRKDKLWHEYIELLDKVKDELEKKLGEPLSFQFPWHRKWARVYALKKPIELAEELKEWAVDTMVKFYDLFRPLLDRIDAKSQQ